MLGTRFEAGYPEKHLSGRLPRAGYAAGFALIAVGSSPRAVMPSLR